MFRSILAPIDASAHAMSALAEAVDLARCANARLTVMTCMPSPARSLLGGGYAFGVDTRDVREAEREYGVWLSGVIDGLPADLPVTRVLAQGRPAEAILAEVRGGGHDLVVMGSRGHGDVHALITGSVSHHVLHASPVAVLLVRAQPGER